MVQYSKRSIPTRISDRLLTLFFHLLLTRNKNELELLFGILFTKAERTMILKRVGIQYMLLKHNDKSLICEMLNVSSSTVAYYAIQLDTQKEGLIVLLRSILLSEQVKNILEDTIAHFLIQPNLYRSHKKIQRKYEFIKERKKHL